jgi:hypothetical protein
LLSQKRLLGQTLHNISNRQVIAMAYNCYMIVEWSTSWYWVLSMWDIGYVDNRTILIPYCVEENMNWYMVLSMG